MKKYIFVGAMLVTLTFVAVGLAMQGSQNQQRPTDVSMVQLIANPKEYHGKFVRVIGFASVAFEGTAVYLHQDDYKYDIPKNGLWLVIDFQQQKKFDGRYVLVEGTFDAEHYGHHRLFSGTIKDVKRLDRNVLFALGAAKEALGDAGVNGYNPDRVGIVVGCCIGGFNELMRQHDILRERGPDRVNPFSIPAIIPNMGAAWVSMELGTRGPLWSECTACAASNMAIGQALDDIRLGRADVMLAGGTEAGITKVGIGGFGAMRALSRRNDDPEGASRPSTPSATAS